ncbi:MAG: hypothetical protein FGM41_11835 [Bacteroidetes bacterium]|nr:hypothetical protein [Bacteroidota bacterium]
MNQENKDIENFLSSLKQEENGFEVPEQYFELLPNKILQQLPKENPKVFKLQVKQLWINGASIAAMLLVVFGLFLFEPSPQSQTKLSGPSEDELLEHLQQIELNTDLLCEAGWCNEVELLEKEGLNQTETYLLETENNLIIDAL